MARLPQPGGDKNAWGHVANEFLGVSHNPDGTIKPAGIQDAVSTQVETALSVQLVPSIADALAEDDTVAAAAAAAIDAEPRVSSLIDDMNSVNTAVSEIGTTTNVLAALQFDPADPKYGAVRGEVDGAQRILNSNAINMAADDARDDGGILIIKGVFECSGGVQIQSHVDGRSGELHFFDTSLNPAVLVGYHLTSTQLRDKHILLPSIRQRGRTGLGWSGNDIGLTVGNAHHCHITITGVHYFSIGARFTARSTGNVYNNIYLGIFENNKIGLEITTENAGGWTNENVWIGGRFAINSAEGTNIPGARHIVIRDDLYSNNNHLFLKPSIEGEGPEYHVEMGGDNNTIMQGRWEASPPKLLWGANADSNVIMHGWGDYRIQTTGFASRSRIITRQSDTWYATNTANGIMRLGGSSSRNNPLINLYPEGNLWDANLENDWMVSLGARYSRWKNPGDAHPRIEIDASNGRMYFGDGADAPSRWIGPYGSHTNITGDRLYTSGPIVPEQAGPFIRAGAGDPNGSVAAPPGSLYMRTNGTIYRKSTGTGNTGWVEMS